MPIGDWVILEACRQIEKWRSQGRDPIKVGINISAVQLERSDIASTLGSALARTNTPANKIEVEITESSLIRFAEDNLHRLASIKALGVDIAIDDFGTGYSSLSYLKHFKVNRLKIDRTFIKDLTSDPDDRSIIAAICTMSQALGMRTIAEGVETRAQARELALLNIEEGQGFFWSRPIFPEDIDEWFPAKN